MKIYFKNTLNEDTNSYITGFSLDEDANQALNPPTQRGNDYYISSFGFVLYKKCKGYSIQNGTTFFYCTRLMMCCPDKDIIIDSHLNLEMKDIPLFMEQFTTTLDDYLLQLGVNLEERKILIMPGFMPSPGQDILGEAPGILLFREMLENKKIIAESISLIDYQPLEFKLNLINGSYEAIEEEESDFTDILTFNSNLINYIEADSFKYSAQDNINIHLIKNSLFETFKSNSDSLTISQDNEEIPLKKTRLS